MNQPNNDTWVVFCTGASIKGRIEELKEHFNGWSNSICVNNAVRDFDSTYWAMLDSHPYEANPNARDRKIITSCANYERVLRADPNLQIYEKCGETTSNSGSFGVIYAISKGAKKVITCGLDLDEDWKYYDDADNSHQNLAYTRFVNKEFHRFLNFNGCRVLSVNKNNTLGLDFYDTQQRS